MIELKKNSKFIIILLVFVSSWTIQAQEPIGEEKPEV